MKKKYDWVAIGKDYNENGMTVKEVCKKYGCCSASVTKAVIRKDLKKKSSYELSKTSLGEIKERCSDRPRKNVYQNIRENAHIIMKHSGKPKKCGECGWDKHVQIHHKKAIGMYPDTALIEEINSLENLQYLCPNCHWEIDNK